MWAKECGLQPRSQPFRKARIVFGVILGLMENQMEKKMENEMETRDIG